MTLEEAFPKDRGALVGYLMAGDPTPKDSLPYLTALAEAVDLLEIGIPFSDPIADGPTIQAAATRALEAGMRPAKAFEIARTVRDETGTPVALMTYFNLLHRRGVDTFLEEARDAGVEGVIVPDLPLEEADEIVDPAAEAGIDAVFLASPASDEDRLGRLTETTSGFLYLVSTYGITGSDVDVDRDVAPLVEHVTDVVTEVPVAVGFGVRSADHARAIRQAGADGVVVGSAFVERVAADDDPAAVAELAEQIKAGLS